MSQSIPEDPYLAQTGFDDEWQRTDEFEAAGEGELEIEEDRARER